MRYSLSRNAKITITFKRQSDGAIFTFRNAQPRAAADYQVIFNGIVDGYTLPNEQIMGDVLERLIHDGDYTWTIAAADDSGKSAQATGALSVHSTDPALPLIQDFSVSPKIFTPNQDGIDDRVEVNVYLSKAATLSAYLLSADGVRYNMPERIEQRQSGEAGAHIFDYDGGLDNNVTPPPNGDYTVVAEAQDAEGQITRRTDKLTIKDSGLPLVEIQPETSGNMLTYDTQPSGTSSVQPPPGVTSTQATIQMQQGDLLVFKLNVYNYGPTPIRTIGPWPGTIYDFEQVDGAFLSAQNVSKAGAWRIGLQCDTSETSLPWRWAIGDPTQLTKVTDDKGDTFYYLDPGKSTMVWGAIKMSKLVPAVNPQQCWAALIHEGVGVAPLQSTVGTIQVTLLAAPTASPTP